MLILLRLYTILFYIVQPSKRFLMKANRLKKLSPICLQLSRLFMFCLFFL